MRGTGRATRRCTCARETWTTGRRGWGRWRWRRRRRRGEAGREEEGEEEDGYEIASACWSSRRWRSWPRRRRGRPRIPRVTPPSTCWCRVRCAPAIGGRRLTFPLLPCRHHHRRRRGAASEAAARAKTSAPVWRRRRCRSRYRRPTPPMLARRGTAPGPRPCTSLSPPARATASSRPCCPPIRRRLGSRTIGACSLSTGPRPSARSVTRW